MATSPCERSHSLLSRMISECTSGPGFGSMSVSYYDTAWLSMVESPSKSEKWLFPQSFDFIILHQGVDGAWQSYASQVDGILNTAACLLSLKIHIRKCLDDPNYEDWVNRSLKADAALNHLLQHWNVDSTDQVGFEILVVKHLDLLAAEGSRYDFPQYNGLRALCHAKLNRLAPESVYKARSTLYHSLEGLIGYIDFDQVVRWQEEDGSMLGSPSSTAAYLIHSSTWDSKAEAYLRTVVEHGAGKGNGSVPSAWPSSIFEITWATTTLVAAGIPIPEPLASSIAQFVERALSDGKGTVGFTSTVLADADDTARALMTLRYMKRSVDTGPLIQKFECQDYFRTYDGERNPSFSANCNILICLLLLEDPAPYASQVSKALRFLCKQASVENFKEKWHTHKLYWMLLLSQAFELIYNHVRRGTLTQDHFGDATLQSESVPLISLQLLTKTMSYQSGDGSWDGECETTAYGILLLSSLSHLPWIQQTHLDKLVSCIYRAKSFLRLHRNRWDVGSYVWIEKTTYASAALAEAYCLAAAAVSMDVSVDAECHPKFAPLLTTRRSAALKQSSKIISRTQLFSEADRSILAIAQAQASYSLSDLQRTRLDVFPLSAMDEDKYLAFIPLTWTACSTLRGGPIGLSTIREMIFLSMINYQADEYLEEITENVLGGDLHAVNSTISDLCSEISSVSIQDDQMPATDGFLNKSSARLEDFGAVLRRYITHILRHPQVLASPAHLQQRLARELRTFLHAHVQQAHDNIRFNNPISNGTTDGPRHQNGNGTLAQTDGTGATSTYYSPPARFDEVGRTFFNWVHGTSADHTSCPLSFIFFNCLIAGSVGHLFTTARTSYLAESLARHLAALCRMYNDYGSIARDKDEKNLNSVNFPDFHLGSPAPKSRSKYTTSLASIKTDLLFLAEYERKGLQVAMEELESELGECRLLDAIKLFIDVTDLYGQVYVLEDYGARKT